MIIDEIIKKIYNMKSKIITEENKNPMLVVYIGLDTLHTVLSELSKSGMMMRDAKNINEDEIVGCKVYRVATPGHGWRVVRIDK